MYELKREKMNEYSYKLVKGKSFEFERFCDFLGSIVSKYIHEIDVSDVPLETNFNQEIIKNYNEITTIDISWSDIKKELMK